MIILSYLLFISFWAYSTWVKAKREGIAFKVALHGFLIVTIGWLVMFTIIKLWQD